MAETLPERDEPRNGPLVLDVDGLRARAGSFLGHSHWHEIDQTQIQRFADATGDQQWIHVDVPRAAAGPFGTPIAHGYLTLSLAPVLLWEVLDVVGASRVVNYGLGKVRFPTPVPVGSRVRGQWTCGEVEDVTGGVQATFGLVVERDGSPKPACVADILFRYYV
jgi:acyl dehydratase